MKKLIVLHIVCMVLLVSISSVYAETVNDAETPLTDTLKFALISSLIEPVDRAITEIYKNDPNVPGPLSWATYDTEILKIKQVSGIGGSYKLTLKVYPYFRAHNNYGIDEVVINTHGELISYRHLQTYPVKPNN